MTPEERTQLLRAIAALSVEQLDELKVRARQQHLDFVELVVADALKLPGDVRVSLVQRVVAKEVLFAYLYGIRPGKIGDILRSKS